MKNLLLYSCQYKDFISYFFYRSFEMEINYHRVYRSVLLYSKLYTSKQIIKQLEKDISDLQYQIESTITYSDFSRIDHKDKTPKMKLFLINIARDIKRLKEDNIINFGDETIVNVFEQRSYTINMYNRIMGRIFDMIYSLRYQPYGIEDVPYQCIDLMYVGPSDEEFKKWMDNI